MPEPLSEEEIEEIVDDVIAEVGATSMADLGRVMADVMPQIAGRADGSRRQPVRAREARLVPRREALCQITSHRPAVEGCREPARARPRADARARIPHRRRARRLAERRRAASGPVRDARRDGGAARRPRASAGSFDAALQTLFDDVLPFTSRSAHPRFFAYVPFAGTWPGALGDFVASACNVYAGSWQESAGPTPARARAPRLVQGVGRLSGERRRARSSAAAPPRT